MVSTTRRCTFGVRALLPNISLLVTVGMQLFRGKPGTLDKVMLSFLQDEIAGLRSRWPRLLALLTCLVLALVVAQQERAIAAQADLLAALSGDSNKLQKIQSGEKSEPKVSVYITDSHILEPASKAPETPQPTKQSSPARFQHQI